MADGVRLANEVRVPMKTKPRRVFHLLKHCGHGNGNVHVAVDLACMQARAGYEVTFFSAGGTFVPLLQQNGVQHRYVVQDQRRPQSLLSATWKVLMAARKIRPQVIHAHMMGSALVGYVASKLTRVPLVTTVHNSFDRHSKLMALGDRVVAVSRAEQRSLEGQGYRTSKLTAIMNAPDESPREAFMQGAALPPLRTPCIVAANGLHRRKGVSDLLKACSMVLPEMPAWHLYIAGEGPDREILEEQAGALGLSDRVTFLGFLPSPRPLLEQADIFVLASYADPCSLAIGEALAAGCAVIATSVGGTPEMLNFGESGRLVTPGKPVELAAELRSLMTNDDERMKLRAKAKAGAGRFKVQRLVLDYEQVYSSAMQNQGPAGWTQPKQVRAKGK